MLNRIKKKIIRARTTGTIAPSSRFLVNKMISKIDFTKDLNLLQLGFGTGVFTKEIIKKLTPNSTITVFEVNENCKKYKIEDPRIIYIEASAEEITKYSEGKKYDHIISTLPFASLPKNISGKIFNEIKLSLKEKGKFLQFQYSLYSRKDITNLFNIKPKIGFELLNLPPAFIYETENIKLNNLQGEKESKA